MGLCHFIPYKKQSLTFTKYTLRISIMTNYFQKILKILILGISVTSSSHGMHVLRTGGFSSIIPSRTMSISRPFFLKQNGEKDLSSDFEINKILSEVEIKDPKTNSVSKSIVCNHHHLIRLDKIKIPPLENMRKVKIAVIDTGLSSDSWRWMGLNLTENSKKRI